MDREHLKQMIEELVEKAMYLRSKEIDAGACRTKYDYQRAREAEDRYYEKKDEVFALVDELVK